MVTVQSTPGGFFPIVLSLDFNTPIPEEVWVGELFLESMNIAGVNDPLIDFQRNYRLEWGTALA